MSEIDAAPTRGQHPNPPQARQTSGPRVIEPEALGSRAFREAYGLRHAYLSGAMYKGIASAKLVTAMGRAGLMGYFGAGGLRLGDIERNLLAIQSELVAGEAYGMNLLADGGDSEAERQTVALYLKHGVRFVEAAAYVQITPALVQYRLAGAKRVSGRIVLPNHVLAKVSRPEVAEAFMRPAPPGIVEGLVSQGKLTAEEAALAGSVPMAGEICAEADSGGHTDQRVAYTLIPALMALRDTVQLELAYDRPIFLGAAGGIGTPHAAAAAFVLGADFVVTGSINQCTVEAGTSEAVKDLLAPINVQDTAYAPAGDMFELGARIQVLRKGLLFPARANKLYELYMRHGSWEEIDLKTRTQIEQRYFQRSFGDIWAETENYLQREKPSELAQISSTPKRKMAAIFKWYFVHTTRLALSGSTEQTVDYQVHCGSALGAFNQCVKGTDLEDWRKRHVAEISDRIMHGAASLLGSRFAAMTADA